MEFTTFIQTLYGVISGGATTAAFTRTIFEVMVTDAGSEIVSQYKTPTYKAFYNGKSPIDNFCRKINVYIEPEGFVSYINEYEDSVKENLVAAFSKLGVESTEYDIADVLSEIFKNIIIERASVRIVQEHELEEFRLYVDDEEKFETMAEYERAKALLDSIEQASFRPIYSDAELFSFGYFDFLSNEEEESKYDYYLTQSKNVHKNVRMLLYPDTPVDFRKYYVCNTITRKNRVNDGLSNYFKDGIISDATIDTITDINNHIIISGTGGIGKSMMLKHLYFDAADNYLETGCLPILLPLKDLRENIINIKNFIYESISIYDSSISKSDIEILLSSGRAILLLDGLDEIKSEFRADFQFDIDSLVKEYPDTTIIMTSRPSDALLGYNGFSIYDIQPFNKKQALELIDKIDYFDESKEKFRNDLDKFLYRQHQEFAGNPLLLSIMLLTHSMHGDIPAKMHIFYNKAFDTMARLHDATKGSYVRPLHTGLTPEDFKIYFSEFCVRTYKDQVLEFSRDSFAGYMNIVIKNSNGVLSCNANDFLQDLCENLCIMYEEGGRYYFIHRSFQEYFSAVYFSNMMDKQLEKTVSFFSKVLTEKSFDHTFPMLYDMIPKKVEYFIFVPYLKQLLDECRMAKDSFFAYLKRAHNTIIGYSGDIYGHDNDVDDALLDFILRSKGYRFTEKMDYFSWSYDLTERFASSYQAIVVSQVEGPEGDTWDEQDLIEIEASDLNKFETTGTIITIDIDELYEEREDYIDDVRNMKSKKSPFMQEFYVVNKIYDELSKEKESKELDEDWI